MGARPAGSPTPWWGRERTVGRATRPLRRFPARGIGRTRFCRGAMAEVACAEPTEEEWELLEETQRLLYQDMMLDNFALVASMGCWCEADKEAASGQNISAGVSQVRTAESGAFIQKTFPCEISDPFLKNVLHLAAHQRPDSMQEPPLGSHRRKGFLSGESTAQAQTPRDREGPFTVGNCRAPFVQNIMVHVPERPSAPREGRLGLPVSSGLLQSQTTKHEMSLYRETEFLEALSHSSSFGQYQGGHSELLLFSSAHSGTSLPCAFPLTTHVAHAAVRACGTMSREKPACSGPRTDHREAPHVCTECGRGFLHSSHFKVHQRSHSRKTVRLHHMRQDLWPQRHTRHQSTHAGESPFDCRECGKAYGRSSRLMQHQRVHTGERPYPCGQCGKAFQRKDTLEQHRRFHTGEWPYRCGQCGKSFGQSSHLRSTRGPTQAQGPMCAASAGRPSATAPASSSTAASTWGPGRTCVASVGRLSAAWISSSSTRRSTRG